jgi:hypothetical protein
MGVKGFGVGGALRAIEKTNEINGLGIGPQKLF